ncbi:THUMP-like domain-containing protein [Raineya sp.]|jgi:16S rRNA G966 N2-methylase RsmD
MQDLSELQTLLKHYLNVPLSELPFALQKYPTSLRTLLMQQIEGRRKIQNKVPHWYENYALVFPPALNLEQSSSEKTAFFKAQLLSGNTILDLTGGFGVDTWAFAQKFKKVWYVEKNPDLFQIVRQNFEAMQLNNVSLHNAEAQHFLQNFSEAVDYIYLDPARRNLQGKSIAQITETEPNILQLLPLLFDKTEKILLKTSPMFEIKEALKILPNVAGVYVVSVQNECKEVLYLLEKNFCSEWQNIPIYTYNLLENNSQIFTSTFAEESKANVHLAPLVQEYLYEPNSSILKAGFFRSIAEKFNLYKLHSNSHLYTQGKLLENFSGRVFRIKKVLQNPQKELPEMGSVFNIIARNYPLSVSEICKKYKIKEGGKDFLIATTLASNQKAIIWAEKL